MNKKAQSATEFMLIFVFIMGAVSFLMVIVGVYTQELTVNEEKMQIDSFANSIISEFEVLQSVEEGYEREVVIPKYLLERYNVTITDNYLVIQNLENLANENDIRYYEISGGYKVEVFTDSRGNMHLVLNSLSVPINVDLIELSLASSPKPVIDMSLGLGMIVNTSINGNITTSTTSNGNTITTEIINSNLTIITSNTNSTIIQQLVNGIIIFSDGNGTEFLQINQSDSFTIITDNLGNLIIQQNISSGVIQFTDNDGNTIIQQINGTSTIINQTIDYMDSILLQWDSFNVTGSCTASGDWVGTKPASGNVTINNINVDRTYILTCPGVVDNFVMTFNVFVNAPLIPTLTFSASPQVIPYNTRTNLSWIAQNMYNISYCTSSWNGSKGISGNELTENLTSNTTYILSCVNPSGSITENVTVEVLPLPEITFYAEQTTLTKDSLTNLVWNVSYATNCTGSFDWFGDKGINGTQSTGILNNVGLYRYTLTCEGSGGINNKTIGVNVINDGILNIWSNILDYNIATALGNPVNPLDIVLTINEGVIIGSTSTSNAALSTGNLPIGSTVTIINNGRIQGAGGNGGHGTHPKGYDGGDAIYAAVQMNIENLGEIWSGGGGGGALADSVDSISSSYGEFANGGGGAGLNFGVYHPNSEMDMDSYYSCLSLGGSASVSMPSNGTLDSGGGSGGSGCVIGLYGGSGGNPGENGAGVGSFTTINNGGLAGYAIQTNNNLVTFIGAKGDIRGRELGPYSHKLNITSNIFDYNIANELGNPTMPINVELTISSGIVVGSTSTTNAALSTDNLPVGSTVKIINNGRIQGKGGNGGIGQNACQPAGTSGETGGNALDLSNNIVLDNVNGQIWSGGGGGGGGGNGCGCPWSAGNGGGGGAGSIFGTGGIGTYFNGYDGTDLMGGTSGTGGAPHIQIIGGTGGIPGMPGTSGAAGCSAGGGTGGLAGYAIQTNGNTVIFIGDSGDIKGREVSNIIISGNVEGYNLANVLGNPTTPVFVTLTINQGVIIGGNNICENYHLGGCYYDSAYLNGGPLTSLDLTGLPGGSSVTLINNGKIQGHGGAGGTQAHWAGGTVGKQGGTAIKTTVPLLINKAGQIWGGGGGGGSHFISNVGSSEGGGGAGVTGGIPVATNYGCNGGYGTATTGGSGCNAYGSPSGAGGGPGLPGQNGPSGAGGGAGNAIDGNSYITWNDNTGDIRGPIN